MVDQSTADNIIYDQDVFTQTPGNVVLQQGVAVTHVFPHKTRPLFGQPDGGADATHLQDRGGEEKTQTRQIAPLCTGLVFHMSMYGQGIISPTPNNNALVWGQVHMLSVPLLLPLLISIYSCSSLLTC